MPFSLWLLLFLFARSCCWAGRDAGLSLKEESLSFDRGSSIVSDDSTEEEEEEEDPRRRRLYTTVNLDAVGGPGTGQGFQFQLSTPTWQELKSSDGIKFSPRHNHASCLFTPIRCAQESGSECLSTLAGNQQRLWVAGGKVEFYQMYNLVYSSKQADVWYSEAKMTTSPPVNIGADWKQIKSMRGDFFAQNADVVQPGPIAPWFHRFGHTLTAYDSDKNGVDDMMLLMGGYAPDPIDDIWVTEDGFTWTYHKAKWSARAWHSTVVNNGTLFVMGGSPLNNEVWRLDFIGKVNRTTIPLTRSAYMSYTYQSDWTSLGNAAWSPRAAMNVLSQWYFNVNQTVDNSTERMVLIGGYGGFPVDGGTSYDGLRCRGDVWTSTNGSHWTLIGPEGSIPPRAWAGATVLYAEGSDPEAKKLDAAMSAAGLAPRMFVAGGGYVGFSTSLTASQLGILGLTDLLWSRDGITWKRVNYEQGAGTRGYDTFVKFYSSQEWTTSSIDGSDQYLGLWGQTMVTSNNSLIMLAGDLTDKGIITSTTWQSLPGIFCDVLGVPCNNAGVCGPSGCQCNGMKGEYCTEPY